MHNCLILGCGRSGTSLTNGLLGNAGYYFGSNPIKARNANPKGFFEDHLVNYVNEQIMVQRTGSFRLPGWLSRAMGRTRFQPSELWLAILDEPVHWKKDVRAGWIIRELVSRQPFAFKDPRFCYTLNAWRPYLADCKFVCIFRQPGVVANSIARELATEPYYRNLSLGPEHPLRVWEAMYRQVLDFHCTDDSAWLFIEYDQLLAGTAIEPLASFLDANIDAGFIDQKLSRSRPESLELKPEIADIYRRLQQKAETTQAAALNPTPAGA